MKPEYDFDEELVWYWDDVTVARNEGIISGYTDEKGGSWPPALYISPSIHIDFVLYAIDTKYYFV